MRKVHKRMKLCLLLILLFGFGMVIFYVNLFANRDKWTTENYYTALGVHPMNNYDILISQTNDKVDKEYIDKKTKEKYYVRGTYFDRTGQELAVFTENGITYNPDENVRRAMLHSLGDKYGFISTGALRTLCNNMSQYKTEAGEYTAKDHGNNIKITIDSRANAIALNALGSYKGTIGVYNYKTGEILCMVSTPCYDPENVPLDIETNSIYEGAFLNRFLSSTFTPGSTMKTVTLQAAIDTIPELDELQFTCKGSYVINELTINCTGVHGTQNIYDAYANSCNCAFAQLSERLDKKNYMQMLSTTPLTNQLTVDGTVKLAKGSFDILNNTKFQFAWSSIGLHKDMVNPASLLVYMGAIANGGSAAIPTLLMNVTDPYGNVISETQTNYTDQFIATETANKMRGMMIYNISDHGEHYSANRFNVKIGAKTGTVDRVDGGMNGWFTGFVNDERYPYAFVCYVDNGGYGRTVAGDACAKVLNYLCQ